MQPACVLFCAQKAGCFDAVVGTYDGILMDLLGFCGSSLCMQFQSVLFIV